MNSRRIRFNISFVYMLTMLIKSKKRINFQSYPIKSKLIHMHHLARKDIRNNNLS